MSKDQTSRGKIILGDCLEVMRGMADNSVDLIVTDPPYNISQKSNGLRNLDYGEWDKDPTNELVFAAVKEMVRISKGTVIIFTANQQFSFIHNYLESRGLITKCLVWLKTNPNVMNAEHSYVLGQELIVYGKKRNATYNPPYKLSYFKTAIPSGRLHPTQKPLKLIKGLILDCSKEGDIVLDPFLGSGTTTRACKDLNRKYIGIEIDPDYFKIAEQRLKQEVLL